jgi:hypothetical protein
LDVLGKVNDVADIVDEWNNVVDAQDEETTLWTFWLNILCCEHTGEVYDVVDVCTGWNMYIVHICTARSVNV